MKTVPPETVDHVDSAGPVSTVTKIALPQETIAKVRNWSAQDVQTWMEKNALKGFVPLI